MTPTVHYPRSILVHHNYELEMIPGTRTFIRVSTIAIQKPSIGRHPSLLVDQPVLAPIP